MCVKRKRKKSLQAYLLSSELQLGGNHLYLFINHIQLELSGISCESRGSRVKLQTRRKRVDVREIVSIVTINDDRDNTSEVE